MIVVDASVLANALGDDEEDGQTARAELISAGDLAAPDLIDVETTDFERVPTLRLIRRAYELRVNVTAHDATYVALAEALVANYSPRTNASPVRPDRSAPFACSPDGSEVRRRRMPIPLWSPISQWRPINAGIEAGR